MSSSLSCKASNSEQVVPSIGLTYALYALIVQDWGIGGVRGFTHLDQQDEAALAAGTPAS